MMLRYRHLKVAVLLQFGWNRGVIELHPNFWGGVLFIFTINPLFVIARQSADCRGNLLPSASDGRNTSILKPNKLNPKTEDII